MGNSFGSSNSTSIQLDRVDDQYETKMVAFEMDCADGKGDATACHHVGEFFSSVKEDYARAAKVYKTNCTQKGYAPSCFNLGRLHMAGRGVELDDKKAEDLFDKACDGGHLRACYLKGVYLYTAVDIAAKRSSDATEAATSTSATSTSATSTSTSVAVKPATVVDNAVTSVSTRSKTSDSLFSSAAWQDYYNKQNALKKFDWACRAGDVDSCYLYASHYLEAGRKDRNPKKAIEHLTLACDRNHAPSCYNLAVMYSKGDTGVPIDSARGEELKATTNDLIQRYGGLQGQRTA